MWPFSTIRRLREEVANLKEVNRHICNSNQTLSEWMNEQDSVVRKLKAELEQARRNDYRDKTGKFAKRPSNV